MVLEYFKQVLPFVNLTEDDIDNLECYHGSCAGCWDRGATKGVFIPYREKVVYKIPLTGTLDHLGDYEGFCAVGVNTSDYNGSAWNYCEFEQWIYERAVEEDIQVLFAENILITEINGHNIYKQDACSSFFDKEDGHKTSKEAQDCVHSLYTDYHVPFEDEWLEDVVDAYGANVATALIKFINFYNLGDFHAGNYGYRNFDGKPIIFDYADFCD